MRDEKQRRSASIYTALNSTRPRDPPDDGRCEGKICRVQHLSPGVSLSECIAVERNANSHYSLIVILPAASERKRSPLRASVTFFPVGRERERERKRK